jgi:hypothetical protein
MNERRLTSVALYVWCVVCVLCARTRQTEIKELMRLLAQKRKEEEELTRQIHGLERNVVQVTDRFKNEMERIGIERDAIAKDNHKYSLQMVRHPLLFYYLFIYLFVIIVIYSFLLLFVI